MKTLDKQQFAKYVIYNGQLDHSQDNYTVQIIKDADLFLNSCL
jgi:hypothetical protein